MEKLRDGGVKRGTVALARSEDGVRKALDERCSSLVLPWTSNSFFGTRYPDLQRRLEVDIHSFGRLIRRYEATSSRTQEFTRTIPW